MRKPLEFSEAEMQYIRENYAHRTAKSIAEVLSRNHHSVKRIIRRNGLCGKSRRTVWTDERLEKLRALYPTTTNEELAKIFETTEKSISAAAFVYKLVKTEEHIIEHRKGTFDGSRPVWNKGMKGLLIPGSEKGFFKKGNLPHNTKYDGAITVRTDSKTKNKYYYKRISLKKWVPVHLIVWEESNGKLSKEMVIRHINGDSLDNQSA